jgi:hypothetical protein
MTQLLEILIAITDAVMGSAGGGGAQHNNDFIVTRSIWDRKLYGQVV